MFLVTKLWVLQACNLDVVRHCFDSLRKGQGAVWGSSGGAPARFNTNSRAGKDDSTNKLSENSSISLSQMAFAYILCALTYAK